MSISKVTQNFINKSNVKSILNTKPLSKLPEYLILHKDRSMSYRAISTQTGKVVGYMQAFPEYIKPFDERFYPDLGGYSSFYISTLKSSVRRQGVGRALVAFARHESLKKGCGGRVHLVTMNLTKEPTNRPIVAYRKMGFDSAYEWAVVAADNFINLGKELSPMVNVPIPMFLPVKNYCAKFNKFCAKLSSKSVM